MRFKNYIHLKSGKQIIYVSDTHLAKKFRYAKLHEITIHLDDDCLVAGSAVEYIKTIRNGDEDGEIQKFSD